MTDDIEVGPEGIEQDLANAIRESLPLIRQLARKPKHVPGDEQYQAIAKRLVEHLKRNGVEKVIRQRRSSMAHKFP